MAIAASSVLPVNSLEDFRIEFNNLVSDVSGMTASNKFDASIISFIIKSSERKI